MVSRQLKGSLPQGSTAADTVISSCSEALGGVSASWMRSVPPAFCACAGPATASAASTMAASAAPGRTSIEEVSRVMARSPPWRGRVLRL